MNKIIIHFQYQLDNAALKSIETINGLGMSSVVAIKVDS